VRARAITHESPQTGETLDHYEIEKLVARSGMASIFRAKDLDNGRAVAIKFPHPEMEADPVTFDRFKREQDIGEAPRPSRRHESLYRCQTHRALYWSWSGWTAGSSRDHQRAKKISPERAVKILTRVLEALEYIHALVLSIAI